MKEKNIFKTRHNTHTHTVEWIQDEDEKIILKKNISPVLRELLDSLMILEFILFIFVRLCNCY